MAAPDYLVAPAKNFLPITITGSHTAATTTIVLGTGDAAKFPDAATEGSFPLTWFDATTYSDPVDDPNVEIVLVTATDTINDELTATRGQEGTTAVAHGNGSVIQMAATADATIDRLRKHARGGKIFNAKGYDCAADGTTDDETAFKAAIAAAVAAGGAVYVPAGTYNFPSWTTGYDPGGELVIFGDDAEQVTLKGPNTTTAEMFAPTDSLVIRDIGFDTWSRCVNYDALGNVAVDRLWVERCKFGSLKSAVHWQSPTRTASTNTSQKIASVRIVENRASTLTGSCFAVAGAFDRAEAVGNDIQGCDRIAIQLGNDDDEYEEINQHATIRGNLIKNVTAAAAGTAYAIRVNGWYALVDGNTIRNVTGNGSGDEAHGVYAKCRWSVITSNVIAGVANGVPATGTVYGTGISLKGNYEGQSPRTGPYGYSRVVTGNVIDCEETRRSRGINLDAGGQLLIHSNLVDRIGEESWGISTNTSGFRANLVSICHNTIRGKSTVATNQQGIRLALAGNQLKVCQNGIENVKYGIVVSQTGLIGSDLDYRCINVDGNTIRNVEVEAIRFVSTIGTLFTTFRDNDLFAGTGTTTAYVLPGDPDPTDIILRPGFTVSFNNFTNGNTPTGLVRLGWIDTDETASNVEVYSADDGTNLGSISITP